MQSCDTNTSRNRTMEEHYMRQALRVAEDALKVGEVPVGCVIVLRNAPEAEEHNSTDSLKDTPSVIISHGANQVNATRDATRHAECVAIDRVLTGGLTTDHSRLPQHLIARAAHGRVPDDSSLTKAHDGDNGFMDHWVNVEDDKDHWKNKYGWGTGKLLDKEIFQRCDLYVTCEPCIMCAAALARVGIGRVIYGCQNSRFGGNGSILNLHLDSALPSKSHKGYPIVSGVLENEAIALLRTFYERENFHAPEEKRKRKLQSI